MNDPISGLLPTCPYGWVPCVDKSIKNILRQDISHDILLNKCSLSTIGYSNTYPPGKCGGFCPADDTFCNQPTDLCGIRPKLPQVSTNWHPKPSQSSNSHQSKNQQGRQMAFLFFRAYRDCLCQPLRRNSMVEVDLLFANELFILTPFIPRVGQPRLPCEVWDTQWWSLSIQPWLLAPLAPPPTSTKLSSLAATGPTPPPARLSDSEPSLKVFLHSQLIHMSVHLIPIGLLLLVHLLELQQALPPKFGKLLFITLLQLFIPIPVGLFTVNSFIKTVLSCYISKMQVDCIICPLHCPSLHIIPVIFWKNNWNLSKANYQSFFWLWKCRTMKSSHSSGSNEHQPFFGQQIFPEQRSRQHWHGVSFWRRTSKCSARVPTSLCHISMTSSGKGRTFETFDGYSPTQSLPRVAAQVDPNPMSCHPFALLDTTNDPWPPISQLQKIKCHALKILISSILTLLLGRNAFHGQIAHLGFSSNRFASSVGQASKNKVEPIGLDWNWTNSFL